MKDDFMKLAYLNAFVAYKKGEVPIGAVIVKDNVVISCGFNTKESTNCVSNHAEIIAITEAEKKLQSWRLSDCDLYVTFDPCPMCASAIRQARIKNVYSAFKNTNDSNYELINKIFSVDSINPKVNLYTDLDYHLSKFLLKNFFKERRNN